MYYFNRGDEGQAWRLIGVAARSCIEMGLHRRESLLKSFNNEAEYHSATKLFWVVYALDRRWSFGMGMPFALQDADIDPSLPEPVSRCTSSIDLSTNTFCSRMVPALICNRSQDTITSPPRSGTITFRMKQAQMPGMMVLGSSITKCYNGTRRFQKACNSIEAR